MNKRVITSLAAAAMIFGVVGTASATQSRLRDMSFFVVSEWILALVA